jgi:DNA-binding response OmpR family regulator
MPRRGAMRVLLIEDDPKTAKLLAKGLHEEGFVVDLATTDEAEDEQAFVNDYDMILLDWLVSGNDGIAVCRVLRARDRAMPILMISARQSVADRVSGLKTGADDYLTKPFEFVELVARMRALLRRSRVTTPPVLRVSDVTLDPANRCVTRSGVRVDLTSKEYTILELLMQNAGEAVSRTRLVESVWHETSEVFNNLVDVHVCNLRKKLECEPGSSLIQTVRGYGFRLGPPRPAQP